MRVLVLPFALALAGTSLFPAHALKAAPAKQVESSESAEAADSVWVNGVLQIDTEGRVESAEFTANRLKPRIAERVLEVVRGWRFQPFQIDGSSRGVRTSMSLELAVVGEPGQRRLQISQSRFGQPIWTSQPPPTYPATSLRNRHSAEIVVAITVDEQGKVVSAEPVQGRLLGMRVRSENAQRRVLTPFVNATLVAVRQWQREFGDVAARGGDRFLVPMRYTIDGLRAEADPRQPPLLFDAAASLGEDLGALVAQMQSSEDGLQALPLQPTVQPLADVNRVVAL